MYHNHSLIEQDLVYLLFCKNSYKTFLLKSTIRIMIWLLSYIKVHLNSKFWMGVVYSRLLNSKKGCVLRLLDDTRLLSFITLYFCRAKTHGKSICCIFLFNQAVGPLEKAV